MVINTMPRLAALLMLLLTVTVGVGSLTVDPSDARRHAEEVRATYPRPEASNGETAVISYIVTLLERQEIPYTVHDFGDFTGGHSFSKVIVVFLRGASEDTLLVAVPLNHPDDAPPDEDRSASLAAAIATMEAAARVPGPLSFRFVFLGAEFGAQQRYPMGSPSFLEDYFPNAPHAVIYLDAGNAPVSIETGGNGRVSPDWLLTTTVSAARMAGLMPQVRPELNQLHRLGISDANRQLVPFLDAAIPAVLIRSAESRLTAPNVSDDAAALAVMMESLVAELGDSIPSEWDRHYLYFQLGPRQLVISEGVYLTILMVLLFSTLLYGLLSRNQLSRYLKTIWRNIWNLPVLFVLVFAFLTAGTMLLRLFLLARGFPTLWQYYPTAYVGLKISLSVFLFALTATVIRHVPLSKNGSFYSASALFVLFIDIILFSALNLSVGYYFIWAFGFTFLFSVAPKRILKALALLAAPLFLVRVAVEVLSVPELGLSQALLLSPAGDLILSFMTFPFLLMLIRLDFLVRHPVAGRRSFALRIVAGSVGVIVVGLTLVVVLRRPFGPDNPQPVQATDIVDYTALTRTLLLESPAPLGTVAVTFAGEEITAEPPGRVWEHSTPRLPDVLSVRLTTEEFLDRDRVLLTIDAPQPIDSLTVEFRADDPMEIYDMSYPFHLAPDRQSAQIFIGKRPTLPVRVEYTLARGTMPEIDIEAVSPAHPDPLEISRDGIRVSSRMVVRTGLVP